MDRPVRIESLRFVLDDTTVWDGGVACGLQLHINGKRIAEDYFPGILDIELTQALCRLHDCIESLDRGDDPSPYLFPCGSCGELGCSQIHWNTTIEEGDVEIRMHEYVEPLGTGLYRIEFETFVAAVVDLFDDFIREMEVRDVVEFDFPHSTYYELHVLDNLEAMREDLVSYA